MNHNQILDFYNKSKCATLTDQELRDASNGLKFSLELLYQHGSIDYERYDRLTKISPEEHYHNITLSKTSNDMDLLEKYNDSKIKVLIQKGHIQEDELYNRRLYSRDELDMIMGRPPRPVETVVYKDLNEILKNLPPLFENRVDIFVLGVSGSGKSFFLSGLFKAADDLGILDLPMLQNSQGEVLNHNGIKYARHLIKTLRQGRPFAPNVYEFITYMNVNFEDESKNIYPVSFMELSGELFEACYGKLTKDLPERLRNYLFHPNLKMLFFVIDLKIDLNEDDYENTDQWTHFQWFLELLRLNDVFSKTLTMSILITKWDLATDQSPEAAERFVKARYRGLYKILERYMDQYKNLKISIMPFSVGNFDARNTVSFDKSYSEKVLNWIIKNAFIETGKKKSTWW
ncbi:hypothetical protein [Runella sp. SP2]|uniref:hypothetical protein n=1 Tax=Runella sp. SP2 TaxID=2268026 RepID=UPI000F080E50|nr:hypothetical protein [Runella sp. SP2]AYQ36594.1 hypothetical protein DTQ70_30195 [Runella sp. SP2]